MSKRKVVSGYPNGYFYPDNYVTRGEFAKIMVLAAGLIVSKNPLQKYKDVSSTDWYAAYIEAAKDYLTGNAYPDGDYYKPNENALREDIAVALVKLKGYSTAEYDESILKEKFQDYLSISEGSRRYVLVAVEKGLISGYQDNTFKGSKEVTRAEAATLLWRAYKDGNESIKEETVLPTVVPPAPTTKPTTDPSSGYEWIVDTIGTDIGQVEEIVAIENGVAIVENDIGNKNKVVKTISNDGKVETVFNEGTFPWQGPPDNTVNAYSSDIISIGFNEYTKELYVWIDQDSNTIDRYSTNYDVVYNITKGTRYYYYKSTYMMSYGFGTGERRTYIRCSFQAKTAGKIHGFFSNGNIFLGNAIITPSEKILGPLYVSEVFVYKDKLYTIQNNKVFTYNSSNEEWTVFDSDKLSEGSSYPKYLGSKNGKTYFYVTETDEIVTLDVNGNKGYLLDTKKAFVRDLQLFSGVDIVEKSAIDSNENVIFYDPDSHCIRRISRNPRHIA